MFHQQQEKTRLILIVNNVPTVAEPKVKNIDCKAIQIKLWVQKIL